MTERDRTAFADPLPLYTSLYACVAPQAPRRNKRRF